MQVPLLSPPSRSCTATTATTTTGALPQVSPRCYSRSAAKLPLPPLLLPPPPRQSCHHRTACTTNRNRSNAAAGKN